MTPMMLRYGACKPPVSARLITPASIHTVCTTWEESHQTCALYCTPIHVITSGTYVSYIHILGTPVGGASSTPAACSPKATDICTQQARETRLVPHRKPAKCIHTYVCTYVPPRPAQHCTALYCTALHCTAPSVETKSRLGTKARPTVVSLGDASALIHRLFYDSAASLQRQAGRPELA